MAQFVTQKNSPRAIPNAVFSPKAPVSVNGASNVSDSSDLAARPTTRAPSDLSLRKFPRQGYRLVFDTWEALHLDM